jgi:SAM-dependent methyltransferase
MGIAPSEQTSSSTEAREERDRELFNRIAASYAQKDVLPSTRHARKWLLMRALRSVIADNGGRIGVVVEIGCGAGAQALHLESVCERYIGIDYSESLIDAGRQLLAGAAHAELRCVNIKSAEMPAGIADLALVVGALHHMTELDLVMQRVRHLIRPGGHVVLMEPSRSNPTVQFLRWIRTKIDSGYSAEQHYFSRSELSELLVRAGAKDVRVEYQGFASPPFAQVAVGPQWLALPIAKLSTATEPCCEAVFGHALGWLSWDQVGYGRF